MIRIGRFSMKISTKRGSVLGITIILVIGLSIVAIGILGLSISTYRLSIRNQIRAEARSVAESELEALFFQLKTAILIDGATIISAPALLPADIGSSPTSTRNAFLADHRTYGWRIKRSIQTGATFAGTLPGTTKRGQFTNIDIKVEVLPPVNNFWATYGVRVGYGRLLTASSASIFQSCVFFQGCDLEMSPSGNVTIEGDIVSNSSIYMGASGGGTLTLRGSVTYLQDKGFNTNPGPDEDFTTNGDNIYTTRKPNTGNITELTPPTFAYSQATQLKTIPTPENLLGGADAGAIQASHPDIFPTINDVYRSLLVPPPEAGNTNEYSSAALSQADDPAISAQRVYNRAGLTITVRPDNTIVITKPGTVPGTTVDVTSVFASAVIAPVSVYDQREGRNVKITDIDIGVLATLAGRGVSGNATSGPYPDFNGILYVNQQAGDSSNPTAIRLINGKTTPRTGSDGLGGFSVATNGGIYVKGSYNTTPTSVTNPDGTPGVNPAMLMGDSMTVLSDAWNDANAASTDILNARNAASLAVDSGGALTNVTTINAGLLTGNTQATSTTVSGGVQNLVRYLENWGGNTVSFNGSLGRLFDAKMFIRPFQQPGIVYRVPDQRNFKFDSAFIDKTPPGSPVTADLQRGRFYYW